MFTTRWSVMVAVFIPGGLLVKWHKQWCKEKAVCSSSASSISMFQEQLLESNDQKHCASPKKSENLSIPGKIYKNHTIMAMCLHLLTQNQRLPSVLSAKKNRRANWGANSVWAGSLTFVKRPLWILYFGKSFTFSPARYGTQCIGLVFIVANSPLWIVFVTWPKYPSHFDLKGSIMWIKLWLYATWSSSIFRATTITRCLDRSTIRRGCSFIFTLDSTECYT